MSGIETTTLVPPPLEVADNKYFVDLGERSRHAVVSGSRMRATALQ